MSLYDLVKGKIKDDSGKLIDPDDYTGAIAEALKHYSGDRPIVLVADITGADAHDYDLPNDWNPGFSGVIAVEYPAGQVPENWLDTQEWKLYQTAQGQKLRILTYLPTPTETIRITYSVPCTETTVPGIDLEAVANLAASRCLRQLAAAFAQTSDSTISADVVNYRSKMDEFRRLSDSFEAMYHDHLGIKPGDTTPAAMTTAMPVTEERLRLTHSRKWRFRL